MPNSAYTYEVLLPMIHPVAALPGDVLRVRPGHDVAPLTVWRCVGGQWVPVRDGPPNYGALIVREEDDVIRALIFSGALRVRHAA